MLFLFQDEKTFKGGTQTNATKVVINYPRFYIVRLMCLNQRQIEMIFNGFNDEIFQNKSRFMFSFFFFLSGCNLFILIFFNQILMVWLLLNTKLLFVFFFCVYTTKWNKINRRNVLIIRNNIKIMFMVGKCCSLENKWGHKRYLSSNLGRDLICINIHKSSVGFNRLFQNIFN